MRLCVGQSNHRLCSTWLSDARPLLPALSSFASHIAAVTLSPPSLTPPPQPPPPPLLVQLPLAAHTRGRANLLFSASNLPPHPPRPRYPTSLPPPHFSPPPPFLSFSSPLTKSLFRLHSAENHMECDITRAGSRERGNGRAGERLACQVSVR